ncbi:uncharacterized protein LOC129571006 [Sitodiplosis mosellana]|uniref:uncharacterized protein LOC129571006 n=1 Tax=Sitodiplosis mosellana TaxID=263140 RepID=UPI0024447B52|nr:uncharacterized protein LOC129571006 [Sitodiplosis mosellana]
MKPSEEYLKHYLKAKSALKLHSLKTICNFCSVITNDFTDFADMYRSDLRLMNFIQDLYIRSALMESSPEKGDKCGSIVCNECYTTMKRFHIHWKKYSKSPEALARRNETAGPSNATNSTNKSSSPGQSSDFWGDTNEFPSAPSSVYTPQNEPSDGSNREESSSPVSASNIEVIAVGSSPESQSDKALNTEVIDITSSSPDNKSNSASNSSVGVEE